MIMSKITVDRALLEKALEALENSSPDQYPEDAGVFYGARDALRAALAQEEQEPVAKYSDIVSDGGMDPRNKFDHPPRREWVSLTNGEILKVADEHPIEGFDLEIVEFVRAIERELKEKNCG
jgi:hypothetical protein